MKPRVAWSASGASSVVSSSAICGFERMPVVVGLLGSRAGNPGRHGGVGDAERRAQRPVERAVDAGEQRPAGLAVLLQLDERRHQQVAAGEAADAAAQDGGAVAGDVPGEAEARLDVVRVDVAAVRDERVGEVGVVAVGVEVVAQAEAQGEVRGDAPVVLHEAGVERGRLVDLRVADAVGVRQRDRAGVGDVEHQPVLEGVLVVGLLDPLHRDADLEVVVALEQDRGVAQLEQVAGALEVADRCAPVFRVLPEENHSSSALELVGSSYSRCPTWKRSSLRKSPRAPGCARG